MARKYQELTVMDLQGVNDEEVNLHVVG